MFDSNELDHELDRLIDGKPVEEGGSLIGAAKAISALNAIKLDKRRKDELMNAFLSRAVELSETRDAEKSTFIFDIAKKWRTLTAQKVAAVALAVLMPSGTTVYAASGSMPDSSLYSVKRTAEKAVFFIAPSGIRPGIEMKLARERKEEISYMLTKKKSAKTRQVIEILLNDLRYTGRHSRTPEVKSRLQNQIKLLEKEVGVTFKKNIRPAKTNGKDAKTQGEKSENNSKETSPNKSVNKSSGGNSSNPAQRNKQRAIDKNNSRQP